MSWRVRANRAAKVAGTAAAATGLVFVGMGSYQIPEYLQASHDAKAYLAAAAFGDRPGVRQAVLTISGINGPDFNRPDIDTVIRKMISAGDHSDNPRTEFWYSVVDSVTKGQVSAAVAAKQDGIRYFERSGEILSGATLFMYARRKAVKYSAKRTDDQRFMVYLIRNKYYGSDYTNMIAANPNIRLRVQGEIVNRMGPDLAGFHALERNPAVHPAVVPALEQKAADLQAALRP